MPCIMTTEMSVPLSPLLPRKANFPPFHLPPYFKPTLSNTHNQDYAHATSYLLATDAALNQPVVNSEQPVIDDLFGLLVAYGGFF